MSIVANNEFIYSIHYSLEEEGKGRLSIYNDSLDENENYFIEPFPNKLYLSGDTLYIHHLQHASGRGNIISKFNLDSNDYKFKNVPEYQHLIINNELYTINSHSGEINIYSKDFSLLNSLNYETNVDAELLIFAE